MDSLNIYKPLVIGHSLGGAITQFITNTNPETVTAIVLMNTFIKFNETAKKAFLEVIELYDMQSTQSEIMEYIISWVFSKSFVTADTYWR